VSYPLVPPLQSDNDLVVSVTSKVAASVETVFGVIEDLELFTSLEVQTATVTYTSEVKRGLGVKSHWTMSDPATGEMWESDEEIVHYDSPHQYAYIGTADGKTYAGVHTLTQNADGTTRHEFNEVFHFDADPAAYKRTVETMIANTRHEAERRQRER
jgi:Polyketide cyclase / dehydrase and lipid transport